MKCTTKKELLAKRMSLSIQSKKNENSKFDPKLRTIIKKLL